MNVDPSLSLLVKISNFGLNLTESLKWRNQWQSQAMI